MRRIAIFLFILFMVGTGLVYATDSKQTATGKQAGSIRSKAPRDAAEEKPQETAEGGNRVGTTQSTASDESRKRKDDSSVDYAKVLAKFGEVAELSKFDFEAGLTPLKKYFSDKALRRLKHEAESGNADAQVILSLFYLRNSDRDNQDVRQAVSWLKAAAAHHHEFANVPIEAKCMDCERMAAYGVQYLQAALERVIPELDDLGMSQAKRREFMRKNADQIIRYVRGPYYGFPPLRYSRSIGAFRYARSICAIHFRVVGDEVWACSPIRALLGGNGKTARIFKQQLFGESVDEQSTGPCEGVEFSSDWPCYMDSIWFLKGMSSPREPMEGPIKFEEPPPMNCRKLQRAMDRTPERISEWSDIARAARDGDAEAQFKLAAMYTEGESLPQELVEAVKWLEKASAQGHEGAKAELPKVKARLAEMKNK